MPQPAGVQNARDQLRAPYDAGWQYHGDCGATAISPSAVSARTPALRHAPTARASRPATAADSAITQLALGSAAGTGNNRMGALAYEPTSGLLFFATFNSYKGKNCPNDPFFKASDGALLVGQLRGSKLAAPPGPLLVTKEAGEITVSRGAARASCHSV